MLLSFCVDELYQQLDAAGIAKGSLSWGGLQKLSPPVSFFYVPYICFTLFVRKIVKDSEIMCSLINMVNIRATFFYENKDLQNV